MDNIGSRIRELRKKRGASQEDLAKLLGVTKSTISKYELGHREISIEQLKIILDFFGIEYGLFLADLGNPRYDEWNNYVLDNFWDALFKKKKKTTTTSKEVQLMSAFSQLNDDGQQKAVENVELLTKIPEYKKEPPQE